MGPMNTTQATPYGYREESRREPEALKFESIELEHRARGEFEAAARWQDYAASMRARGHTSWITSNGTRAAWRLRDHQVECDVSG